MRQRRVHYRTDEECLRDGFEVFVFHERETGAECRVVARTFGEAHKSYKRIAATRRAWTERYRLINEEALRPFLQRRAERLSTLQQSIGDSLFEDMDDFVSSTKVHSRKSSTRRSSSHDGSVQLELF